MSATTDSSSTARPATALLIAIACALLVGLSLFPPSSTRLQAWPWAGFATIAWLLPVAVALFRLMLRRDHARFGGFIDAGFVLLIVTSAASALLSPIRGSILPHLLPVFGACALPYALLPGLQPGTIQRTLRIGGLLITPVLLASLFLWLAQSGPGARNAQPFGHANITGSVAAIAATAFAFAFTRETRRGWRWFFASGAALSVATAISSGSRGAVIALAAAGATAAAITLLRRGRVVLFIVCALLIVLAVAASNTRLRDLALHGQWSKQSRGSNDQRIAMIAGGIRLGAERPLLGWGAGSVPHVFPRVRGDLPGDADNFLQLHNTPAQLWATLGSVGLLAALLIAIGLCSRPRAATWTHDRVALASGLISASTILLFDHPFATPLFSVLAAAHLSAWLSSTTTPAARREIPRPLTLALALVMLVPALPAAVRDLAARRAFSHALDRAADNDPVGYATALRRAASLAPADPYYPHLLAAQLATGHPIGSTPDNSPQSASALLADSLAINPDLEYAHYNLGWLLLPASPAIAARHFHEAARLAPQRGTVYLGLGLARIQLHDTEGAVRALAAEWLLNPATAWSPIWRQPPLADLEPRIRDLATRTATPRFNGVDPWARLDDTEATLGAPYRRLRTGYGVLLGHPAGVPPVDFNIQTRVMLPPELRPRVPRLGWLDGKTLSDFLNETRSP